MPIAFLECSLCPDPACVPQPILDSLPLRNPPQSPTTVNCAGLSLCWPWAPSIVSHSCLSSRVPSLRACPQVLCLISILCNSPPHWLNKSTSPSCFSIKENPVTRWHHINHTSRGRTPLFCGNRRITHLPCQLYGFQRDSHHNLSLRSCPGHCLSIVSTRAKSFGSWNQWKHGGLMQCAKKFNFILFVHFNMY